MPPEIQILVNRPAASRPVVLIIDDDCDLVRGLTLRLRSRGFDVAAVGNSTDAARTAQRIAPDAIILDIRMPVMDGMEVLSQLRHCAVTAAIPVLMLSANIAETVRSAAMNCGASFYLVKPFKADAVVEAVASVMKNPIGANLAGFN